MNNYVEKHSNRGAYIYKTTPKTQIEGHKHKTNTKTKTMTKKRKVML